MFFADIGVAKDALVDIENLLVDVVRKSIFYSVIFKQLVYLIFLIKNYADFELNSLEVDIISTKRFAIPDRDNLITQIAFFVQNGTKILDARRYDSVKASVNEISKKIGSKARIIEREARFLERSAVSISSCFRQFIKGKVVRQDSRRFEEAFKKSILQKNSKLIEKEVEVRLVSIQETLSENAEKYAQLFFSAENKGVQIDASYSTKSEVSSTLFRNQVTFKRKDNATYVVSSIKTENTSIYEDLRFITSKTKIVESDYSKIEQIYKTEIERQFTGIF